jgi:hypothetical protein
MKTLFISIVMIFFVSVAFAQPSDSIFVIISGDTVHIWNTRANLNCGCMFRMEVLLSNDTIYVTEVDTASYWATCSCTFDLCATINGLQSGTYFVKVFRKMPLFYPDTVFYIGTTSFIYGGSILTFISQSYQSDCYHITEVKEYGEHPKEFTLDQNYPNPFNPSTKIRYELPVKSIVQLKVYDILGREVETLVEEEKPAGTYQVNWNAINRSSGLYFYRLQVGDIIETRKMILMK